MADTLQIFVRRVVERASFLHERLADRAFAPAEPSAASTSALERRWTRWLAQMGAAADDGLRRRLAWSGWSEALARDALAGVRLADDAALPAWGTTLERMLRDLKADDTETPARTAATETPIAFQEALRPFVHSARDQLDERAPEGREIATPDALAGLERELLTRLSAIASDVLYVELQARRAVATAIGAGRRNAAAGEYVGLVADLVGGAWRDVFDEYPVLARLLATTVAQWVDATAELLARLRADTTAIAELLGERTLDTVVAITTGASDRHAGGRTTAFVRFASDAEVVYKPKGLATDVAFANLVAWLNARGASPALRTSRAIDRGTYGWAEHVPHRPCATDADAAQYFERAGMLLALIHALAATDAHADNIVACGEHPVLVDLETLQTPLVREHGAPMSLAAADRRVVADFFEESALATQFLPSWEVGPSGEAYDMGGLEGSVPSAAMQMVAGWEHVNSAEMRRGFVAIPRSPRSNAVLVGGVPRPAPAHRDQIVRGFRRMYELLRRERSALLEPGGPLHDFASLPVRVLVRPTGVYTTLIDDLAQATVLRDGADASLSLERLARALVGDSCRPHVWDILDDELRALTHLDVPRYMTSADCTMLPLSNGAVLTGFLSIAGHARVRARIEGLDAADLDTQSALIAGALGAFDRTGPATLTSARDLSSDSSITSAAAAVLAPSDWLARACDVAERIRTDAIVAADGSATWLTLALADHRDHHQHLRLEPMRHRLYDGQAGMAHFLAALEATTGAGYRGLALAALAPLRARIRAGISPTEAAAQGLGACTGLGSVIYALTRCARWLDEPALLDDARRLASFVTSSLVAIERQPDVMAGVAGMVLALLALERDAPSLETIRLATSCGDRLLAMGVAVDAEAAGWPLAHQLPALTGMGHGAAGIALALARLAAATGREEFACAAEQAVVFERRHFAPEVANWADLRVTTAPGAPPATFVGWCGGAPGIALARLGGLAAMDTPDIRKEIDVALTTTRAAGLKPEHHLCCGTMGLVDALLEGAARLDRPDLRAEAVRRASSVMAAIDAEANRDANAQTLTVRCTPGGGLFRGIAGVGFECIRLADAARVPSVLLFD